MIKILLILLGIVVLTGIGFLGFYICLILTLGRINR